MTATATADGRAGGAARGDADGGDPKKEKKQSLATNASFGAKNKDPVHKKHKTRVLILVRGPRCGEGRGVCGACGTRDGGALRAAANGPPLDLLFPSDAR